ncbi:type VII secretion protein EssB/YukC [Bacillus massiliglaciei]|uniref:type VII secretion protein EssB/YukC n=1 Tax=Bacillus massiliglaciei TaxID=1816693 RepID=UPI000B115592|nr:type VII secretion protein EssB/YukC [Bacillus massiliglaciei]
MKKITMMDNLTLFINKREYKIELDEKFTKVTSLDEIEDLEQTLTGFFDVESISRQNNKIYLVYDIPDGYESLEKAKLFVPVIKLQLIKNLLDIDPLLESNEMTYLDPTNIFFKNFNDIKVLYRSNGHLPYHRDLSALDQYKLFVLGFFSNKYSYKRFLVNKDTLLRKENNEFMFAVNAATSFAGLKNLVNEELEKEQSRFYEKVQFQESSRKKGFKRKIYSSVAGVLLLILIFAGGVKQIEKNVRADFKDELAAAKAENELTLAVSSGDTKDAVKLMEDKGETPEVIANMLVKAGKYDEAIKYDKSIENKVVSHLYKIGQRDKILELKSNSTFLKFEKEIVDFDPDNLADKMSLIEDKDTLRRLALAFMEHDNFEVAKEVLERLKSDSSGAFELSKKEESEIDEYMNKANLEIKVKNLNEQLAILKQTDSLLEEEEETLKREEEIKKLEDELVSLQKKLIKVDEKIGMDV